MELKEVMEQHCFAVVGDTLNPEKYAFRIKKEMEAAGYQVYPVGKELNSINDIPGNVDVIDLCIHPVKGLKLLQESRKDVRCIVIQPGAESPELLEWLQENEMPFIQGCLLVGLSKYKK